jgi:hypothetical protein
VTQCEACYRNQPLVQDEQSHFSGKRSTSQQLSDGRSVIHGGERHGRSSATLLIPAARGDVQTLPGGISIGGEYTVGNVPRVGPAPSPPPEGGEIDPRLIPDLIPATGDAGVAGYLRREDFLGGPSPRNPEEATRYQEERNLLRLPVVIPIYAIDGVTVVDRLEFPWTDQSAPSRPDPA